MPPNRTVRILGIDPGSRATGFGVIDCVGDRLGYVHSGVIRTVSADFNQRLAEIFAEAQRIHSVYRPDELAIERVFVNRNADSALKLGAARAAVICGSFSSGVTIHEYAARQVKQALTGRGGASKEQVQHMVRVLLGLGGEFSTDVSDALAVAVCHGHGRRAQRALGVAAG